MSASAPLFSGDDLRAFEEPYASNPAHDLTRARVRKVFAWLHERLYSEIRAQRWDVYFVTGWSLSPALATPIHPQVHSIQLRYTKSETAVRLMQKKFECELQWDDLAWLGLCADARGVAVVLEVPPSAQLDAQNLRDKVKWGAAEKRALRHLLAEMGGAYVLEIRQGKEALVRARCSRLVDLNVLNDAFEKFTPGAHVLRVERRYRVDDLQLDGEAVFTEILQRLETMYALYHFAVWAPRNDYLSVGRAQLRPASVKFDPSQGQ